MFRGLVLFCERCGSCLQNVRKCVSQRGKNSFSGFLAINMDEIKCIWTVFHFNGSCLLVGFIGIMVITCIYVSMPVPLPNHRSDTSCKCLIKIKYF
uniref:Uncharacterized protein n=1 Tax=Anguilla anguilla TaxID=7936 RepID=A0A0E9TZM4_ANGAN